MSIKDANDAYNSLMDEYREPKINICGDIKFINYKVIDTSNLTQYKDYEQTQIQVILDMDEIFDIDMVDVINVKTNEILYQFYFFDYGSGALYKHTTTEEIGVVCQHGFEFMNSFSLEDSFEYYKNLQALHEAYNSFEGDISQVVEFGLDIFFEDYYDEFETEYSEIEEVSEFLHEKVMKYIEYTQLKNSDSISIRHYYFTNFPIEICSLKGLKNLDLSNNRLKSLPAEITELKDLEFINLNSNQFDKFPEVLLNMSSLKEIKIQYNLIKSISDEILNELKSKSILLKF